jgi:hypothetical protein
MFRHPQAFPDPSVDIIEVSSVTVVSWAVARPVAKSDGRATTTAAMMRQGERTMGSPGNVVQASLTTRPSSTCRACRDKRPHREDRS